MSSLEYDLRDALEWFEKVGEGEAEPIPDLVWDILVDHVPIWNKLLAEEVNESQVSCT